MCFYTLILGPEDNQKECDPHSTIVLEDGDHVTIQNKVEHKL